MRKTNVGTEKIDKSYLDTFGIVIAGFLTKNRLRKIRFFEKIFLLAQTILDVVLRMLFLILAKA